MDSKKTNKLEVITNHLLIGDIKQSLSLSQEYLENDDKSPELWHLLAKFVYKGNKNLAEKAFAESFKCDDSNIDVYFDFAKHHSYYKNIDESNVVLNAILESNEQYDEAYRLLGNNYFQVNDIELAFEYLKKAYEINPLNTKLLNELGLVVKELYDFETAKFLLREGITNDATDASSHFNLGLIELLLNEYEEGWKHFEWREYLITSEKKVNLPFPMPKYDEENLEGKVLFVHHEQGFGDTIQFARYLPELLKRGAKLKVSVHSSLKKLFEKAFIKFKDIQFIKYIEESYTCDYHISMMSLPYSLCLYLPIEEFDFKIRRKNNKLIEDKKFNIGLSWKGNEEHTNNHNRSVELKMFEKLFTMSHIQVFSLQKEITKEEKNLMSKKVIHIGNKFKSFYDTAEIIQELDLVISVDTSISHLSATLGKKTWILIPYIPDWRWGIKNNTTPWYKNVTLFRQDKNKNWDHVIDKVCNLLISSENR